jgi:hypothetical protein
VTSHYLLCKLSGSYEQVAQYLGKYFGNIHSEQWQAPTGRVAVFLGESYFIRANGNAAVLMILKEAGASECNLELISWAGATGILELSWGAHGAYVNRIRDSLKRAGFNVEVLKEIHDYDASQLDAHL